MNSSLRYVLSSPELAHETHWSTILLARKCGVSVRTLQRHFLKHIRVSPRAWMAEQRQREAVKMLQAGHTVRKRQAILDSSTRPTFRESSKNIGAFAPQH